MTAKKMNVKLPKEYTDWVVANEQDVVEKNLLAAQYTEKLNRLKNQAKKHGIRLGHSGGYDTDMYFFKADWRMREKAFVAKHGEKPVIPGLEE
jgi:hypothetical protein